MKAFPVQKLPEGDWLYEIKFDGYRALAFKDGKNVRWSHAIKRRSIILNYSMP
jgi:ATP-dependent DNA ligase